MAKKKEEYQLKVLCPFCSAEQSAEVIMEIDGTMSGCDTCGDGAGAYGTIEVKCCSCQRVIYKKEFDTTS